MNTHFIIFKAKFYSEFKVLKITVVFRKILDFVFVIFFDFFAVLKVQKLVFSNLDIIQFQFVNIAV